MNKSLDYIYNYEPTCDEEEVLKLINTDNKVCDPFLSIEDIDEDDIEEIINIATNKKIAKAQGKCAVRLRDGTELIGRWQGGARQGQGSTSSPALERLGVSMLAGSYRDGGLAGVGRAHMLDGSVREGWFHQGFAHGPWKGDIKVSSEAIIKNTNDDDVCRVRGLSGLAATREAWPRVSAGRVSSGASGAWAGWTRTPGSSPGRGSPASTPTSRPPSWGDTGGATWSLGPGPGGPESPGTRVCSSPALRKCQMMSTGSKSYHIN